jgi:hypothetical protein
MPITVQADVILHWCQHFGLLDIWHAILKRVDGIKGERS